jgi:hypothetical protein
VNYDGADRAKKTGAASGRLAPYRDFRPQSSHLGERR